MKRVFATDDGRRGLFQQLVVVSIGVLLLQVAALLVYFRSTGGIGASVGWYGYPLVWINLTLVAVVVGWHRSPPHSARAGAIAGVYFLLLAWLGGLVSLGGSGSGMTVHNLPPGWGPMVMYDSSLLTVSLVPFRGIGYLGLAYLVYVALGRSFRAGAVGVVGLFSCVSCTGSLLAVLFAGLGGGSIALVDPLDGSMELSMLVFVLSLLALVWVIERSTPGGGILES